MLVKYNNTVYEYDKKHCECCDKEISYNNWSTHMKTKGHIRAQELHKARMLIAGLLIQSVNPS